MRYTVQDFDGVCFELTCNGLNYYGWRDDPRYWHTRYTPLTKSTYKVLKAEYKRLTKAHNAHLKRVRKFKLARKKYLRNH